MLHYQQNKYFVCVPSSLLIADFVTVTLRASLLAAYYSCSIQEHATITVRIDYVDHWVVLYHQQGTVDATFFCCRKTHTRNARVARTHT